MNIKLWLCAAILILFASNVNAQKKSSSKTDVKEPAWIQMMRDPNANYFETVKAFREYYKERPLPNEPNEAEGQDSFEKEVGLEEDNAGKKSKRELERERRRQNPNDIIYASEVRAFKGWFYGVQPWVRSDGSIVNPEEQQSIIDKQKSELKEIEKSNDKK